MASPYQSPPWATQQQIQQRARWNPAVQGTGNPNNPYQTPGWNPAGTGGTLNNRLTPERIRALAGMVDGGMGMASDPVNNWMPSEISSYTGGGSIAGGSRGGGGGSRGGAVRRPVPNDSFTYMPPAETQTPGAYSPYQRAWSAMQGANAAKEARRAQLAQAGHTNAQIDRVMANDSMSSSPGAMGGIGGAGGGSGGGGGGGYGDLAAQYQNAMDTANANNDRRYQDALQGSMARYLRNMGYLEGAGKQEAEDINKSYQAKRGSIASDLASRGLSNTTVKNAMLAHNDRSRIDDQGRLNERLRGQRIATDAQLSGDVLGIIERKEDIAPDFSQLIALQQAMGGAGVGAGGGAGGIGGMAGAPVFMSPAQMGFMNPMAAFGGQQYQQLSQAALEKALVKQMKKDTDRLKRLKFGAIV